MGLLKKVLGVFGKRRSDAGKKEAIDEEQFHQWLLENRRREKAYLSMTTAELKALPEQELLQAAQIRAEHLVDAQGLEQEQQLACFQALPEAQQTIYTLYRYESEVLNGGLCQFFVNSSRMVAPYVSQALTAVGAEEHRQLFNDFVSQNGIDLNDLASFAIEDEAAFEAQVSRYPFDVFDDAFYELDPLEDAQMEYLKEHLESL